MKKILHLLLTLVLLTRRRRPRSNYVSGRHYELVASARAVKIGHAINPDFQIGCMIAMVPIYPYSCNPEDMMMSVSAMQNVIGLPMFMSAVIIQVQFNAI